MFGADCVARNVCSTVGGCSCPSSDLHLSSKCDFEESSDIDGRVSFKVDGSNFSSFVAHLSSKFDDHFSSKLDGRICSSSVDHFKHESTDEQISESDGHIFSSFVDQFSSEESVADRRLGSNIEFDSEPSFDGSSLSDGHDSSKSNDHSSSDSDSEELNDLFIRSSNSDHKREVKFGSLFSSVFFWQSLLALK